MSGVFVYRNLNRKGVVWSVKSNRTGLVVARDGYVMIKNATLKVSKAGQARVRAQGRKNVHAGIVGTWVRDKFKQHVQDWRGFTGVYNHNGQRVTWVRLAYNPYKNDTFVIQGTNQPVTKAEVVILDKDGAWALEAS